MDSRPEVLLFDLGGVLVELVMFHEWRKLTGSQLSEDELKTQWMSSESCTLFETGRISAADFAERAVAEFGLSVDAEGFLAVFPDWCRDFHPDVPGLLEELRRDFRLCCLSNSNEVHWKPAWGEAFDEAFFSHRMGLAKPDVRAFHHVTESIGVPPDKIAFFDDATVNIATARELGFHAFRTEGFEDLCATLSRTGLV